MLHRRVAPCLVLLLQLVGIRHAAAATPSLRGLQEGCSFPLQFHVNATQPVGDLALGIAVRSSSGDSIEYLTGDLSFKPNSTTNVTFPLLPCGASIYGLLVRVASPGTDKQLPSGTQQQLVVEFVEGTYNGRYKRSVEASGGYTFYWGPIFVPFGKIPAGDHNSNNGK